MFRRPPPGVAPTPVLGRAGNCDGPAPLAMPASAKHPNASERYHFLLYRVTEANVVEIGHVLRDSMELQAHLPEEYGGSPE